MSSRLLALVALLAAALGEEAAESSAPSSPPPPLDKTYDMGGDLADDLGTEQPPPELREAMAQMFDELDGEEHIVLFADYGLPAKSMITCGLMGILGAHYAGFGLGLFGLFLAERTSKIRFVVERDHFEIMIKKGKGKESELESSGDNKFVGGANRWAWDSIEEWAIYPSPGVYKKAPHPFCPYVATHIC